MTNTLPVDYRCCITTTYILGSTNDWNETVEPKHLSEDFGHLADWTHTAKHPAGSGMQLLDQNSTEGGATTSAMIADMIVMRLSQKSSTAISQYTHRLPIS